MTEIRKDTSFVTEGNDDWHTEFVSRQDVDGKFLDITQTVNERVDLVSLSESEMLILYWHLKDVLGE